MENKNKEIKILSEEELSKTSGGSAYTSQFGGISWKYSIGEHVEIDTYWFFHQFTNGGTILKHGVGVKYPFGSEIKYFPAYYVDGDSAAWYEEDVFDDDHRWTDADIVYTL